MTHRFIRSLAGVAVVTGLALTLACGGGDDDDNTSVINAAPTNVRINPLSPGVTGHQYLVTANADGGGSTLTYSATSSVGGTFTATSNQTNMWNFTPSGAGLHVITVTAKNQDGASASATTPFQVTANNLPELSLPRTNGVYTLGVAAGRSSNVNLPSIEAKDGDSVSWSRQGTAFGGTFISESAGTVTLTGNQLSVTVNAGAAEKDYTLTGLRSTETNSALDGGIPSGSPITNDWTITVSVGDASQGELEDLGPGTIDSEISNLLNAIRGVPHRIQFVGRPMNNPGVEYRTDWLVNDGSSANNNTNMEDIAWISNVGATEAPEKFTGGIKGINYPPGTLLFLANTTTPFRQELGVRAQFPNGTVSYKNFTIEVESNTRPTIIAGTASTSARSLTVGTEATKPWSGTNVFSLNAGTAVPFKSSSPGSLDLKYTIPLTGTGITPLTIKDPDIKFGDNVKLNLVEIRGDGATTTNVLTRIGADRIKLNHKVDDDNTISLVSLEFTPPVDSVTVSGTNDALIAGQTLTLYYTVTDLAGDTAATLKNTDGTDKWVNAGLNHPAGTASWAGSVISITLPTRTNPAPIIDGYNDPELSGWLSSSADMPASMNGWVSGQPIINIPIEWTIPHKGAVTPAHYIVTDANDASIVLLLDDKVEGGGNLGLNLSPASALQEKDTNFIIKWNPPASYARQRYNFTLGAFNRFGAKAVDVTVNGIVWGPITGKPVTKKLYGTAGEWSATGTSAPTGPILTSPADFSRWTSISFNPFFDTSNRAYANRYGKTLKNMSWTYEYDVESGNTAGWRVRGVPDGFYLISAGETSGVGSTQGPVVGPALTADYVTFVPGDGSMTSVGARTSTVAGVNPAGYPFAYIDSPNPDLTTHVPFGVMAGLVDSSITYDLTGASTDQTAGWANNVDATDRVSSSAVKAYFGDLDLYFLDRPGFEPMSVAKADEYSGTFGFILAGMLRDRGAVQFAFRDTNQKAFFKTVENQAFDAALDYPVGAYSPSLGWNAVEGLAKNVFTIGAGDAGHSFAPIVLNLGNGSAVGAVDGDGALPFQVKLNDRVNVLGMQKNSVAGLSDILPANLTGFYWKAISTGTSDTPAIGGFGPADNTDHDGTALTATNTEQSIAFEQTTDFTAFSGTIDRASFLSNMTYGGTDKSVAGTVARSAVAASNLNDTLQIISYTNGTELGPVDNPNGVPTLLEFGALKGFGGGTGTNTPANFINMKFNVPVPRPTNGYWSGQFVPVVNYRVNYNNAGDFTSFIPGSMGVMTTDLAGNITPQAPITNLRITTVARYHATNAKNVLEASSNLTRGPLANVNSAGAVTWDTGNPPTVPVPAQAYDNDDNGYRAVWLTWNNPTGDFSGNIIEFFDASNAATLSAAETDAADKLAVGIAAGNTTAPLYKVHVGPKVTAFPIPQEWIEYGALQSGATQPVGTTAGNPGNGLPNVIVRVRTVSYGSGANLVDFNETPFIQAFPYKWADTVSAQVTFAGTKFPANPAMIWKSGDLYSQNTVVGTFGDVGDAATLVATPTALAWTLPGTEITSANENTNEENSTITYTWAIDSVSVTPTGTNPVVGTNISSSGGTKNTLPVVTILSDTGNLNYWDNITRADVKLVMTATADAAAQGIANKLEVNVPITPPALSSPVAITGLAASPAGVMDPTDNSIALTLGTLTNWTSGGALTSAYDGPGKSAIRYAWSVVSTTYEDGGDDLPTPVAATITGTATGLTTIAAPTVTIARGTDTSAWLAVNGNSVTVTLRLTVTIGGQTATADIPVALTITGNDWTATT